MTHQLQCPTCQQTFEHRRPITYCSVACANRRRGSFDLACLCCGKGFTVRYKERKRTFCSMSCRTRFLMRLRRRPIAESDIREALARTATQVEAAADLGITFGLLHKRMHEYGIRKGRPVHPRKADGYWDYNNPVNHRRVAEALIGRPLAKGEVPHHIDGDIQNNDPDNLEVLTRSEHMRLHWSLERIAMRFVRAGLVVYDREAKVYRHRVLDDGNYTSTQVTL